jgi:sulfur dioxygenase
VLRLRDGDRLRLGALELEVIATPGHTDDSVSYRIGSNLFTGDALFVRGTGRTDFQNGDAGQLYDSITTRIFSLPDDTRIWPGHDYKGFTSTTVGEEKRWNPRLAGKSRAQFIELMGALGLPPPKHLEQAVPANRELGLGLGPEQSSGGFSECNAGAVAALLARGGVRVIDVREGHEFRGELGHIAGAENVPMGLFPDVAREWDREQSLLLVCRSGRRSREVCQQLAGQGFVRVTNLRGGMLDYRERGREERS